MPRIVTNLWFDGKALEAAEHYCSIFPNSKVTNVTHYTEVGPGTPGDVLTVDFSLDGTPFTAINAGPEFKFNESVSFSVPCEDQQEIDYYWEKLSKVPASEQCGWCKDQYGLSWQIVPKNMDALMKRPDAFAHMMQMKKIVIADF